MSTGVGGLDVRAWSSIDLELVGREREVAQVRALLAHRDIRLITLTGTAGVGKTALSVTIAHAVSQGFPDGVFFVDLAAVHEADLVMAAVGRAIGLRESGEDRVSALVGRHLRQRHVLLLMDNCEHVVAAAPEVVELLTTCPGVRVLATSRTPLKVVGEHELAVRPLPVPEIGAHASPAELAGIPAVALFLRRARAAQPDFRITTANAAVVAEICVRVDGLPLAVELAAARVKALGVGQILARLQDRYRLLVAPERLVPRRHESLRRAVDWSYGLLTEAERAVFRALAVFAGGWELAAAEGVCAGPRVGSASVATENVVDLLTRLVDHSMIVVDEHAGSVRYRLLETLRQYAFERLAEVGEDGAVRDRHRDWCRRLAEDAAAAIGGPDDARWLDRLEADHGNLRAAMDYSLCEGVDVEPGLRLAGALFRFWDVRGYLHEGMDRLEALLARADVDHPTFGTATAQLALGILAQARGDRPKADTALAESIRQAQVLGLTRVHAWALTQVAIQAYQSPDHLVEARRAVEEAHALATSAADEVLLIRTHGLRGVIEGIHGGAHASRVHLEAALTIAGRLEAGWGTANILHLTAQVAWAERDLPRVVELELDAVALLWALGDLRAMSNCLDLLACAREGTGDPSHAAWLFGVTARLRDRSGAQRPPTLEEHCSRTVSAARASLGKAAYDASWSAGHTADSGRAVGDLLEARTRTVPPATNPTGRPAQADGDARAGAMHPTPRELQIAGLVGRGMTNRQIGNALKISERTAERHLENLRTKLGVRSRAEIAGWAATHGITPPQT